MAAKRENPVGGKRAKMGTGRARSARLSMLIRPGHMETLTRLAESEGVTRTTLIERWIDAHAAALPDGPPTHGG